eukprot:1867780-Rhodomonas_salina.1
MNRFELRLTRLEDARVGTSKAGKGLDPPGRRGKWRSSGCIGRDFLRCSRAQHSSPQDAHQSDPEHAVLVGDHAEGQHVDRNPGDQALG